MAQNTVNWNHGDLKIDVEKGGQYTLMSQITNSAGERQSPSAQQIILETGENIVKIAQKSIEHVADGRAPLQRAIFWLEINGSPVSKELWMP